jgi:hypothetical protein
MAVEQCTKRKPFYKDGCPFPTESPDGAEYSSLIASSALEHDNHRGKLTPGAVRYDLCQNMDKPFFAHFATDINGKRIIADSHLPEEADWRYLYVADLPSHLEKSKPAWRLIADSKSLNSNSSNSKLYGTAHTHPFLSPDGNMGFFNSNESGILRPYIIKNL